MTILICGIITLLGVLWLLLLRNTKRTSWGRRQSTSRVGGSIPSDKAGLTLYLQKNVLRVERVKRQTRRRQKVPKSENQWLDQLGRAICRVGLATQDERVHPAEPVKISFV